MLRNVNDLRGFAVHATDGIIGEVDDFYFDDEDWAIRYLIVDTGGWLSGRKVLISPYAIGVPDWDGRKLPVSLTKAQVEGSPDIDTQKPVSRQHEAHYSSYYGYPYYWGSEGLWGLGSYPGILPADAAAAQDSPVRPIPTEPAADAHLRSCKEIVGYHIEAQDGDIGHVDDVLVDDQSWALRYLIVNTSNWWGGHLVLVSPQWVDAVSWPDSKVSVGLTRQAVQEAPPYNPDERLTRDHEDAIYRHYGRPDYWPPRAARRTEQPLAKH
jgi:sporulation protein YlmC with PRC-barrel domain